MVQQLVEVMEAIKGMGFRVKSNGYASYRCQCPAHGGDGLNVVISEQGGNLLAVCHSHGCSFQEIIQALGLKGDRTPEPKRIIHKKPVRNEYNARILQEHISDAPYGDKAKIKPYLASRGITGKIPDDLFFLERCFHSPTKSYYPAIFSYIRDVTGKVVSGHRIYIPENKKLKPPMKMGSVFSGETSGCAIRLSNHISDEIFLSEGIETALSVKILLKNRDPVVWSTMDSSGLSSIKLPGIFKRINIFADRDLNGAGQKAANKAKSRLESEGREVFIILPPEIPKGKKGIDWNDVLIKEAA